MHPSTRNRIGAIALLAGALLGLMACNQATEPNYREGWGAKGSLGTNGASGSTDGGGIVRGLLGAWRQTDDKGVEYGYGDTTTFDVRGGYTYKRYPPALKPQIYREEKGTYYASGDSLYISLTSVRESYDGKQWVEYSPRSNYFTFQVAGNTLTITNRSMETFHFKR